MRLRAGALARPRAATHREGHGRAWTPVDEPDRRCEGGAGRLGRAVRLVGWNTHDMQDEPVEIIIGRRDSDHVLIRVVGRTHPEAGDYWDGNWLISPITARLPGFTSNLDAALRTDELCSFRKQLQRVCREVRGRAELVSIEEWITLNVLCDRSGHLEISGELSEDSIARNTLRFSVPGLDQTDLLPLIRELLTVEQRFPVVGGP